MFNPRLPLPEAHTIPNTWYTIPDRLRLEQEKVFAGSWQCVARVEQLQTPGSYVTCNIAGEPIVLVRDESGVLRGFFNVCRHRAAAVMTEPCGTATKLRCQYHGWTYDLAGQLRGTPEFEGVCHFEKSENGLVPIGGVAEWGPFVWACVERPTQPLEEFLNPLPQWCAERNVFNNLVFAGRREYRVGCNWKVYIDNYLDGGYHVNTVHPGLAGVLNYAEYRTTLYAQCSLQSSPMKPSTGAEGLTRTGDLAAYWWLWPNFMINLYSGVMDTNYVLPDGPDRCKVIFEFYFAKGTSAEFIAQSLSVADQVQAEDVGVCEDVQRGLGSRSYKTGRFSVKREAGAYHFHQLLAQRLA
jgi:choline monooxygenase